MQHLSDSLTEPQLAYLRAEAEKLGLTPGALLRRILLLGEIAVVAAPCGPALLAALVEVERFAAKWERLEPHERERVLPTRPARTPGALEALLRCTLAARGLMEAQAN